MMKEMKKKIILLFMFISLLFVCNINVFAIDSKFLLLEECSAISPSLEKLLNYVYTAIKVSVPIIVLVLTVLDLVKAVASSDEKDMQKALKTTVKRVIIGIAIFFIPTFLNLLLELIPRINGTCGIG